MHLKSCEKVLKWSSLLEALTLKRNENKSIANLQISRSDDSDVFYDASEEMGTSARRTAIAESSKSTTRSMDDLTILRKKISQKISKNPIRRSSIRSPRNISLLEVVDSWSEVKGSIRGKEDPLIIACLIILSNLKTYTCWACGCDEIAWFKRCKSISILHILK